MGTMEPLEPQEARELLRNSRVGVLALADGGKAYALPLHFGYDGSHIYFHSHHGLKDEFIKTTREACLAVTVVGGDDDWESVLVFGPVDKVQMNDEILAAMDAMMAYPPPPEFGFTKGGAPKRSSKDMYFWRLRTERITGRKSEPAPPPEDDIATA